MLLSVWTEYAEYIVGVPSALLAIWFAYWVYQKQNKRKIITSNYKVLSILDKAATNSVEGIKIQYNAKEVDNLYLAIIEFRNDGQIDFEGKDFEKPIKLVFRKEDEWLEPIGLEVSNRTPANLDVEIISPHQKSRAIKCGMLNCGESFTVTAYLESKPDGFEVDARILGISEISPRKVEIKGNSLSGKIEIFSLILSFCLLAYAIPMYISRNNEMDQIKYDIQESRSSLDSLLFNQLHLSKTELLRLRQQQDSLLMSIDKVR